MQKLSTITLGCSKNKVDTEHILSQVEDLYEIIPEGEDIPVDVLLINTCGFIGDAKEESINTILELTEAKKEGLIGQIIVMGCLSERYMAELEEAIPEVDQYYGKFNFKEFADSLPIADSTGSTCKENRLTLTPKHYAYIKISEGCDRRCAYCAIPLITGKHNSRKI